MKITNDILESLNMAAISPYGIPTALLHDIADALSERDKLRTALQSMLENKQPTPGGYCVTVEARVIDDALGDE